MVEAARAEGYGMAMTLLVFKINQLGDNLVYLPVMQAITRLRQRMRVVLFTSKTAARLHEACCPGIEVRSFETSQFNSSWRSPVRLARLVAAVRREKPEMCLLGDDQGSVAHVLARFSGAQKTAGPLTEQVRLNRLLQNRVPALNQEAPALHNWRIARALLPALPLEMPAPDLSAFGREDSNAIVIHAGASREYQRWPVERFAELAGRMCAKHAVRWIEQPMLGNVTLDPRIERVQTKNLDHLVRVIAGARFFIGNNSGPMHIASATGVPGLILTGPSAAEWSPVWHPERLHLLREPLLPCQPCDSAAKPVNRCLNASEPFACLRRWSVAEVHRRVCELID